MIVDNDIDGEKLRISVRPLRRNETSHVRKM